MQTVFLPTSCRAIECIASYIHNQSSFVDLGCGDGAVVEAVARANGAMQCYGVELNESLCNRARIRCKDLPNVELFQLEISNFSLQVD